MTKKMNTSKRAGYKRKNNKRINPLADQLKSRANKVLKHDEQFGKSRKKAK